MSKLNTIAEYKIEHHTNVLGIKKKCIWDFSHT